MPRQMSTLFAARAVVLLSLGHSHPASTHIDLQLFDIHATEIHDLPISRSANLRTEGTATFCSLPFVQVVGAELWSNRLAVSGNYPESITRWTWQFGMPLKGRYRPSGVGM